MIPSRALHLSRRTGEGLWFESEYGEPVLVQFDKVRNQSISLLIGGQLVKRQSHQACLFKVGEEIVRLDLLLSERSRNRIEVYVRAPRSVHVLRSELLAGSLAAS